MSTQPTAKSGRPFRYTKENLYTLLPSIYRDRDAELGKPLEALLGVIAEQVEVIEKNIDNLYEDWFIETCYPWVVPYIGDLVGARLLNEGIGGDTLDERAYVGNTISYRRRKGTVSMLEELSANITGWPAKVVEFFELLETTQNLNHLRPGNLRTPDIRNENSLELLDTPFDTIAHTVEVRHIDTGRGYYNIPNLGIFLYRLTAFPVQDAPAYKVSEGCFRFNALGLDELLFNNPVPKTSEFQLAQETNAPLPIRRTALFDKLTSYYASGGIEKSIKVTADGATVSSDNVTVYDLSGWWRPSKPGQIAIDPALGRLTFAAGWNPSDVHVSYFYGFSGKVGGGFYPRPDPDAGLITVLVGGSPQPTPYVYVIRKGASSPKFGTINAALSKWTADGQPPAIFEIEDSEAYQENISITLPAGVTVEIRASQEPQERRPILVMKQPLTVTASTAAPNSPRGALVLNGLVFDQAPATPTAISIQPGDLGALTLRHCTIVPAGGASLNLVAANGGLTTNDNLTLTLDHSITGGISIDPSVSEAKLVIQDSIVDGKGGTVVNGSPGIALDCYCLTIEESTVFGKVRSFMVNLASNTIFTDTITVRRRQVGCVRFCYLPPGSRVPRPYKCQPDYPSDATPAEQLELALSVKPIFTSKNYGDPGYAQLSKSGPAKIFRGADNGAEMGVFNELLQALRVDNLNATLNEYLRFELEAGIFLVT